jgi:hypothetical protein
MRSLARTMLCAALLALTAGPLAAQSGEVYCNITEIKAEQLSNGVQITIVGDGELWWELDWHRLYEEGAWVDYQTSEGWWWSEPTERFRTLPILIYNARSMLGSGFVAVGKYPVSHAEISIPGWAEEGVGLAIDFVHYVPWVTGEGDSQRYRFNLHWNGSEDGNSILLSWTADRFPPPPPPPTPEDLPAELEITEQAGLLSVRAVNAKLEDVAGAIGRRAGFPVAAPRDGDLRVSLCLDAISPDQALQAIAAGCGLAACQLPAGGWVIAESTGTAAGYGACPLRRFGLSYLPARAALDLLPNFLVDYAHADEETNSIVATGPEWMLDRLAADLAELDQPPPQVSIEIVAVEYTSGSGLLQHLQIERSADDLSVGVDTLAGALNFLRLDGLPAEWRLLLRSLETEGAGRLRSEATVRVLSGRTAHIFSGEQRNVIIERFDDGATADILPVEVGTVLDVQPSVGSGDEVLLHLTLEVRSLASTDPATSLPVVAFRTAHGALRAHDGETIAIAGLRLQQESREQRAIPILGSLPLIGRFFQVPAADVSSPSPASPPTHSFTATSPRSRPPSSATAFRSPSRPTASSLTSGTRAMKPPADTKSDSTTPAIAPARTSSMSACSRSATSNSPCPKTRKRASECRWRLSWLNPPPWASLAATTGGA